MSRLRFTPADPNTAALMDAATRALQDKPACRICGTPLRAQEQQPADDRCPHGWAISPLFPMPNPTSDEILGNTPLCLEYGDDLGSDEVPS